MFPALVRTPDDENDRMPPNVALPAPPSLDKVVASLLPAIRIKSSTYSPIERIEQLLPIISNEIKESRSQAAQSLLARIATNNRLLLYELCATRIQSLARKFVAQVRVRRIRRRTELFLRITKDCAERYLEEFVLSSCLEMSLNFYRQHHRFKLVQSSVERELVVIAGELQQEVLQECILEVANDTISDVIDVVVRMRYAVPPWVAANIFNSPCYKSRLLTAYQKRRPPQSEPHKARAGLCCAFFPRKAG
jgi:hypothetical protein